MAFDGIKRHDYSEKHELNTFRKGKQTIFKSAWKILCKEFLKTNTHLLKFYLFYMGPIKELLHQN